MVETRQTYALERNSRQGASAENWENLPDPLVCAAVDYSRSLAVSTTTVRRAERPSGVRPYNCEQTGIQATDRVLQKKRGRGREAPWFSKGLHGVSTHRLSKRYAIK